MTSCKKDKEAYNVHSKTETPIQTTIAQKIVVDTIAIYSEEASFELGQKIFFSKKGKITKLGCFMPEKGSYTVTFWNFETQNLLTATTIEITDTTKFLYNSITPFDITPNTRYVVSVNNHSVKAIKKCYAFFKKSNTSNKSLYPFSTGSVTWENYLFDYSDVSTFPSNTGLAVHRIFGIADFVFEYEE